VSPSPVSARSPLLWFGILGGPIAWGAEVILVFVTSRNCKGNLGTLITGTILLILVAVASFVAALLVWRQTERTPSESAERVGFYATGGMYIGAISIFVVVMAVVFAVGLGNRCT
jgi:hypothetical protein